MLKSHGPSTEIVKQNNAAEHFESDHAISEPAFEPTAIVQEKEGDKGRNTKEGTSIDTAAHSSSKTNLPKQLKSKMEYAFDADFSNVNIDTNSHAASDLGAKAFAQGNNISFAPGAFNPGTHEGQNLIGHELAHVVQQRSQNIPVTQQFVGIKVNHDSKFEAEADGKGRLAADGKKTGMRGGGENVRHPVTQGFGWGAGEDFLKKAKKSASGIAKKSPIGIAKNVAKGAKATGGKVLDWGADKVSDVNDSVKDKSVSGVAKNMVKGAKATGGKVLGWGAEKFSDAKELGMDKAQEAWTGVKEKGFEAKDWINEKSGGAIDKASSLPNASIDFFKRVAYFSIDKLKDICSYFGPQIRSVIVPKLIRLMASILKLGGVGNKMQEIIQTIVGVIRSLAQKLMLMKDKAFDSAELERFADFFRSLAAQLMENKNDMYKFATKLQKAVHSASISIINNF